MAQVALLILGQSLEELGYQDGLYSWKHTSSYHTQSSFTKLAKVDSLLGPEMKSTGEVVDQIRPWKAL